MNDVNMTRQHLAKFESRFGKLERNGLGNLSTEQEWQLQGWLAAVELLIAPMEVSSGVYVPTPRSGTDRRKQPQWVPPSQERRVAERRLM